MATIIEKCKDCTGDFEITDGEQSFYKDKGFYLPKRCPACRVINKARNEEKENQKNG